MVERSNPESREFYWPAAVKQPQTMDVWEWLHIFYGFIFSRASGIICRVIKLKAL